MNAVTYGGARAPATAVTKRAQTELHKSFFTRFMEALENCGLNKLAACLTTMRICLRQMTLM